MTDAYPAGFVVHDEAGRVLRSGSCPSTMLRLQAINLGERVLEIDPGIATEVDGDRYRVSGGFLVPLPPKPGQWAIWDGGAWIDPRTPDDFAREVAARRAAASITKTAFITSCMAAGILTPGEAATAARGDIPPSFEAAIASMGAEARDMVRIIWPSVTRIERMDPFILAVAEGRGISDETLDAIFGIV